MLSVYRMHALDQPGYKCNTPHYITIIKLLSVIILEERLTHLSCKTQLQYTCMVSGSGTYSLTGYIKVQHNDVSDSK